MKFEEIQLYQAIARAYQKAEKPRSAQWLISRQRDLYAMIVNEMDDFTLGVPWPLVDVIAAWDSYGKQSSMQGGDDTKIDIICELAKFHSPHCFYRNRGRGECSGEVDLDRIFPGSRGGIYTVENCVISCSKHNRQRQDKSIEDFIGKGEL